jgi:hypothetical protein
MLYLNKEQIIFEKGEERAFFGTPYLAIADYNIGMPYNKLYIREDNYKEILEFYHNIKNKINKIEVFLNDKVESLGFEIIELVKENNNSIDNEVLKIELEPFQCPKRMYWQIHKEQIVIKWYGYYEVSDDNCEGTFSFPASWFYNRQEFDLFKLKIKNSLLECDKEFAEYKRLKEKFEGKV